MMVFKTATLQDIPELNLLVNSAYRGESAKVGWTTEADLIDGQRTDEKSLQQMIQDSNAQMELVIENQRIIGCVYLSREEDSLYFGMLTVKPNLQNQGLGKHLLNRVEEVAKTHSLKKIRMTVISVRRELIEYYERRGYKWTGETEPFPEQDPSNGSPKQKLTFLVYEKNL